MADPAVADVANNAIYASEVTSEQSMLEDALVAVIDGAATDGTPTEQGLGATARCYLERLQADPQRSFHFGIRYHHRDDFDATLDRIRGASTDPDLAGRVELRGVVPSRPAGCPGAEHDPGVRQDGCRRRGAAGVRSAHRVAMAPV